jgi:hypothetical protein
MGIAADRTQTSAFRLEKEAVRRNNLAAYSAPGKTAKFAVKSSNLFEGPAQESRARHQLVVSDTA